MTVDSDSVVAGARAISDIDFSAFRDPSFRVARTVLEAAVPNLPASKAVAAVLEIHREKPCLDEDGKPVGGSYCEECKDLDDHSGERVHEIYPCLTVREIRAALEGADLFTTMRNKIEGMTK